jgi:Ran GTPase-activating protein (RanGAP) involved in mRNA processing and transport
MEKFSEATQITFSGNSYSQPSCQYLAEAIEKYANAGLSTIDISNIFTTRNKAKLPPALSLLIDAICTKMVENLSVADNAFGPNGAPRL